MRTEEQVTADLIAAREAHHAASQTESQSQLAVRSAKIKALMAELSETISTGAKACPVCGNNPFGRQRTPSYRVRGGRIVPPVYEIACLACPSERKEENGTATVTHQSAQDNTAARAVVAWNRGDRVQEVFAAGE
jgi:hypothetical protein